MIASASTKTRRIKKSLGKNWGRSVQDQAAKEGAKLARALLKAGKYSDDKTIEVHVSSLLHLRFDRKGRSIGPGTPSVRCHCTFTRYPDGSSVCVCTGPDAASCDCTEEIV